VSVRCARPAESRVRDSRENRQSVDSVNAENVSAMADVGDHDTPCRIGVKAVPASDVENSVVRERY